MVKNSRRISMLINGIFFFLESVFIEEVKESGGFRLVVSHKGRILTDRYYESSRGARIAFSRIYKHQLWRDDLKPEWSHFYPPDRRWLEEKLSGTTVDNQPFSDCFVN